MSEEEPVVGSPKAAGGFARAKALSPEERSRIAQQAADARWGTPKATHRGDLVIGDLRIPCAVLEDGRRVLTETGITTAILGRRSGASRRKKVAGTLLPLFIGHDRLKPFISEEFGSGPFSPVAYRDGSRQVVGYDATVLPAACEVWLRARDAGALHSQQAEKARRADLLMRSLAHVGIVALVDEATGYQEVRDRTALQAILDQYLRHEFAAWAKRFPDEFYRQMFRLKGWKLSATSGAKPIIVGAYTKDVVYARLAPGIVEELALLNPKDAHGRRKVRHHQWLTDEIGHSALAQHLHAVTSLMRISNSWPEFMGFLNTALPKKNTLEVLSDGAVEAEVIAM